MSPTAGRVLGGAVLVMSACGFPLTQLAIRRWGVRGAAVSEAVCAGLLVRDAAMVASGVPHRLRRGPATLLWLELAAAATASIAGLGRLIGHRHRAVEMTRRAAVGTLFGLHAVRFWIYLQPDHGRRDVSSRAA